jgi:hypothetical protein
MRSNVWILVNYNKCQTRRKDKERDSRREGEHTKWSIHSLQKIILGDFIFFKRHINKHTRLTLNTAPLLKFTVYIGTGSIRAHILVPGPVIFQNTAAAVKFVPVVLELAGTSELSEVYAEYL